MRAEVVSVGTELLLGYTVDTHAATLGSVLAEHGIEHTHRQTVGDNLARLEDALRLALSRADIVVTIGGLGPTEDDLTREGIAAALEDAMIVDPAIEERLRTIFAYRKLPWVESIARQAQRPRSAEIIPNEAGTAPGLVCRKGGKIVVALPGPPAEFNPMVKGPVRELLRELGGGMTIHSRVLRIAGMGESMVEENVRDLLASANPTIAPYAKPAEVHLRLTARAASIEEADRLIDPLERAVRERLGPVVYGADETTLDEAILLILKDRGETLAVAESCTGGGLGARLTEVPGFSETFLGGVISYSNAVKMSLLGVCVETLETVGAVSRECAEEMAVGARERVGATWGVSITGIAGPTGATPTKPVGLVYTGVAGPGGVTVEEHRFRGGRGDIRRRSGQHALVQLRRRLLEG